MSHYEQTERTRLRLYKDFGTYDKEAILKIVDDAHFCHVSTVIDGGPYIQATRHWRHGDNLYIHGNAKNKLVVALRRGTEACLSFMHFDGYALTRSAFTHAVLYRSVVAFSRGRFVEELDEKRDHLQRFIESVQAGRWAQIRQPSIEELKMTGVVEFSLKELSGKALSRDVTPLIFPGGDLEIEADKDIAAWTGIIPFGLKAGEPISSGEVIAGIDGNS